MSYLIYLLLLSIIPFHHKQPCISMYELNQLGAAVSWVKTFATASVLSLIAPSSLCLKPTKAVERLENATWSVHICPMLPKNTFLIQHNHGLQKSNQSCLHFYNSLLSLSSSDTLFWVKHLGSLGDTLRQVGSHQVQLKKHHPRPGGHRRGSPALECFGATVGGRRQPGKTGKMEMVAKRPIHWWSGHETSALCWHNLYWKQFMVQDWLNNKSLPAKQRHIQRSFSTANIC